MGQTLTKQELADHMLDCFTRYLDSIEDQDAKAMAVIAILGRQHQNLWERAGFSRSTFIRGKMLHHKELCRHVDEPLLA